MKFPLLVLTAAVLAGCATQSKQTIATVRAAGVPERTVDKLEHHGVLTPADLISLHRRGVGDSVALRQLDKVGVDYVVQKDEISKLRSAGVSPAVVDALIAASDRFVAQRYYALYDYYYPSPWHYGGPWWWPFWDVSLGYSWGHWGGSHWDHDHWHGGGHHHH